jgi:hypothetical protein
VADIDWMGAPLREFGPQPEIGEYGLTTGRTVFPHGDGEAQRVMVGLSVLVEDAYEGLLSEEDGERYERAGEVPMLRNGRRAYVSIFDLTLQDLPAVLDTLMALEEESRARVAEETALLEEKRKARRRARDRERRKLKKLGEW